MTDRRQFLRLAGTAPLAALLPVVSRGASDVRTGRPVAHALARSALEAKLGDRLDMRRVGALYRARRPEESRTSDLIAHLARHVPVRPGEDVRMIRRRIEARIRRDFAAGRTLVLDGWVLSVTEARQCALRDALVS